MHWQSKLAQFADLKSYHSHEYSWDFQKIELIPRLICLDRANPAHIFTCREKVWTSDLLYKIDMQNINNFLEVVTRQWQTC